MKSCWRRPQVDRRVNSIKPLVITMGCPAGVGPEIILKAVGFRRDWLDHGKVVVAGDQAILERASKVTGISVPIAEWKPGKPVVLGHLNLLPVTHLDEDEIPYGSPSFVTGQASFKYVDAAISLCKGDLCSAIVTAPISKIGLKYANIDFPGHTEILAASTETKRFSMMMYGAKLKVVLATIHCPLRKVAEYISLELILEKLNLMDEALRRDFAIKKPKIGVAGLNPHAGESGTIGTEEEEIISPAVRAARAKGLEVSGPHPPDTLFFRAVQGEFDAVLCMYHDQGLIPFKLLHFWDGVNVTIGLPLVRTSVDHGTAYDVAGKGSASPESLVKAAELAFEIVHNRLAYDSSI